MTEEKQIRAYMDKRKRAEKLRDELIEIYNMLEKVNYDFAEDEMLAEYIVVAKRSIEGAINDHLLDDDYWNNKLKNLLN